MIVKCYLSVSCLVPVKFEISWLHFSLYNYSAAASAGIRKAIVIGKAADDQLIEMRITKSYIR